MQNIPVSNCSSLNTFKFNTNRILLNNYAGCCDFLSRHLGRGIKINLKNINNCDTNRMFKTETIMPLLKNYLLSYNFFQNQKDTQEAVL